MLIVLLSHSIGMEVFGFVCVFRRFWADWIVKFRAICTEVAEQIVD